MRILVDVEKVDWDKVSVKREDGVCLGPGLGDGILGRLQAVPHMLMVD